jgi:hypothetical protein
MRSQDFRSPTDFSLTTSGLCGEWASLLVADRDGLVTVELTGAGAWYVKFVHMRERQDADANYESRWSTLTFGLQ